MNGKAAIRDDFGDRWNPLLVKELRQTLRSKAFGILFLAAHGIAATLATFVLTLERSTQANHIVVSTLALCAAFACLFVVPILAFQSFGQEWEDNTHDLLVLTELGAGRLAFGKLLGPVCLGWLILVSFAPYLALTAFLEGADLVFLAFLFGAIAFAVPIVVAVAMAGAGIARTRQLRNAVLGLVSVGLLFCFMPLMPLLLGRELSAAAVRSPEFWVGVGVFASIALIVGMQCFLGARAHLSHAEEAPTLPARVTTCLGALVLPFLVALLARVGGEPAPHHSPVAILVLLFLLPSLVIFATERETLGRVARRRVERSRWMRLVHPVLPGGGRGLMLLPLTAALAWCSAWVAVLLFGDTTPSTVMPADWFTAQYLLVVIYAVLYIAPFSFLTWKTGHGAGMRWAARLAIVTAPLLSVVAGMIVGLVIGDSSIQFGRHLMNPFIVLTSSDSTRVVAAATTLGPVAALVLLLAVPRWWIGWRDVHGRRA
jgi:hypothetical protein